jgi:hypothetical protein
MVRTGSPLHQQEREQERERAEALQRIEARQEEIVRSLAALEGRVRLIFWIAVIALVVALAGFVLGVLK